MESQTVYLVPGFFGFTTLGDVSYFHRVAETLEESFHERDFDARVVECPTQPTGSIPRRAARLVSHVVDTHGLESEGLHFVGHSTGGLDPRVMLSPQVHAAKEGTEERIGELTRSLITLSTPHHGAPLASLFTSLPGRRALQLLTKAATSTGGRLSLVMIARALALAARADDVVGRRNTFLDHMSSSVFRRLTFRKEDPVWRHLREVADDQGVVVQLTPESLNLFNALANDRPGVSYSCIATAAPPPPFAFGTDELLSPERALLAGIFTATHTLNRWSHGQYPYPKPDENTRKQLEADLPFVVSDGTSDGLVPTLSQLHGKLLRAFVADHLDVIGRYRTSNEPLSDWLPAATGFDDARHRELWATVADEVVRTGRKHS